MREIKFRAWNPVTEKMYQWPFSDIVIDDKGNWNINGYTTEDLTGDKDNLVLMQYTGLKDKNGKEIFEGDIVKYETSYEREDDNFSSDAQEVKWNEKCAGFFPFYLNSRWRCDVMNVEIIGNIFENPNLIKS